MTKCAVCGFRQASPLLKVNDHTYLQCGSCGYTYIDAVDFGRQSVRHSTPEYELSRINAESKHVEYYGRLSKLMAEFIPSSKHVLDVGCGCGFLLKELMHLGYDAVGVDLGKIRSKYGREKLNVNIVNRNFFDLDQQFGAISMQQFIEHVPNPLDFLTHACRLTPAGGALVVGTPNITPAVFLSRMPRPFGPILGDALGHPPNHCGLFGKNSLSLALERAGFYVVKVINNPTGFMGQSCLRRTTDLLFSSVNLVGVNMLAFAKKR